MSSSLNTPGRYSWPTITFATPAAGTTLAFTTHEIDGQIFASRQELRAEVSGGDGVAEVTFALARASRPGQFELLGTDDAPPYRVFWRPPPDLAPGETLTFIATVTDLRGHRASAEVAGLRVAPSDISFGIRGATVPVLRRQPAATVTVAAGTTLTLAAEAEGTGPLEYQWLRGDEEIAGATASTFSVKSPTPADAGHYAVLVRNRAGTTISGGTDVTVTPARR